MTRAKQRSRAAASRRRDASSVAIRSLKDGSDLTVMVVNGFLTEERARPEDDWLGVLEDRYPESSWQLVEWGSIGISKLAFEIAGALRAPSPALAVIGAVAASWRGALKEAERAGDRLAEQIAGAAPPLTYVLLGHSLGASVVYNALRSLAQRAARTGSQTPNIAAVHLLGGAVGGVTKRDWENAAAVAGVIHNYFSVNDRILQFLYPVGRFTLTTPAIGRRPIACTGVKIVDHDVSRYVGSHRSFKTMAARFLCRP